MTANDSSVIEINKIKIEPSIVVKSGVGMYTSPENPDSQGKHLIETLTFEEGTFGMEAVDLALEAYKYTPETQERLHTIKDKSFAMQIDKNLMRSAEAATCTIKEMRL